MKIHRLPALFAAVFAALTAHAIDPVPAGLETRSPTPLPIPVKPISPSEPSVPDAPPPPPNAPDVDPNGFGAEIVGLSVAQSADFVDGIDEFKRVRTAATGLGPIYNNVSCKACHNRPSVGGWGTTTTTRFGRTTSGVFDPLASQDGSLLHAFTTITALKETIPADANTTAQRLTTPLYGAGLVDAIADATIEANASLSKPRGITGRAAFLTDPTTGTERVGRFGWKAQQATLLAFVGDAFNNEMGITNSVYPTPHAPDGNTALFDQLAPDPTGIKDSVDTVTGLSGTQMLVEYVRSLAPPPRAPATANSAAGQTVFTTVGCAACHIPTLQTGASAVAALSNKPVPLYSDLLLHSMGSLGDGIAQGAAGPLEMRTAPLWGLHSRNVFLHDGRATSLDQAIRDHDGEAAGVRTAYLNLDSKDRQALMEFLNTL